MIMTITLKKKLSRNLAGMFAKPKSIGELAEIYKDVEQWRF